ncbi:uncharacterized protein [Aristolochia californica]|uniref:uncharacterized protein n=1 Tax=Aristolochia californica TaxID=171875 RepID=UPI0035E09E94
MEKVLEVVDTKKSCHPPPPPPLPPLPMWTRRPVVCKSVTREEIERFWRKKKLDEEDHFLAALKAAARVRARNFSDEEYRRFEDSLQDNEENKDGDQEKSPMTVKKDEKPTEIRVGIKDWWTKSKYAYLNQPAIKSMEKPKRTTTYIPNYMCFYKPPLQSFSLLGFSQ